MVSLRQIRYFLTVADWGSFSQAAAALFVAQPALSRQIALLEHDLGFDLFVREARGVSLTPAGEVYRQRLLTLEKQLLAAAEEGGQVARGERGVIRLLHSSSVPLPRLLPAIRQLLAGSPQVRIDLDRIASEIQVTEVAGGKADMGVIRLPVLRRDPNVQLIELEPERLWVALPAAHALAQRTSLLLQELAHVPFVSAVHRERGGLARLVTDLCLQRGFVPVLAPVLSRKTSMLNLVAAGFGVAVIPESMRRLGDEGIAFRPLDDPDALARTALVAPLQPSPLAQRFIDLLCQGRG